MSKSFAKVKEEYNDSDEIYILDDVQPVNTNKSPIGNKLPHKHFELEPKKASTDSCLVNLLDYKRELIEDGDENLLHQFSQEQDVAYDSDDDETVFHKSAFEDDRQDTIFSCRKLNDAVIEESSDDSCVILDDDDDIKFMKENEIILNNVTKKLQEYIDLTGDDNDQDDDDGLLPVKVKQEPNTSPIVIKEKNLPSSRSSSVSKIDIKNENASPQPQTSKKSLITSFLEKPTSHSQISIASDSSSDDVQLSILAAQYDKKNLGKSSSDELSILDAKNKTCSLVKKISDDDSNDSTVDLFFDALNKGKINETSSLVSTKTNQISEEINSNKRQSLFQESVDNNEEITSNNFATDSLESN